MVFLENACRCGRVDQGKCLFPYFLRQGSFRSLRLRLLRHERNDYQFMNISVKHISRALALLAIILLLTQQILAVTCGCRAGQIGVKQIAVSSVTGCCLPGKTKCCGRTSNTTHSCCDNDSPGSGSKPCQCPARYCERALNATEPTSTGASVEDYLSIVMASYTRTVTLENTTPNSLVHTSVRMPTSSLEHCIQVCRYQL